MNLEKKKQNLKKISKALKDFKDLTTRFNDQFEMADNMNQAVMPFLKDVRLLLESDQTKVITNKEYKFPTRGEDIVLPSGANRDEIKEVLNRYQLEIKSVTDHLEQLQKNLQSKGKRIITLRSEMEGVDKSE